MLVDSLIFDNVSVLEFGIYILRNLNELDKNDFRLSLLELKERYLFGFVLLFYEEICYGFLDKLINDIVEYVNYVFFGKYFIDNLVIYLLIYVIDVLEVF